MAVMDNEQRTIISPRLGRKEGKEGGKGRRNKGEKNTAALEGKRTREGLQRNN